MSRAAVDWAFAQRPPKPADKLVLLVLADATNKATGVAFPSVAAIGAASLLNRKMVIDSLGRLERLGFILDTGERIGRTRQIKVWAVGGEQSPIGDASAA